MNIFQRIITVISFSVMFYVPVYSAQNTDHRDEFWGNTTPGAKDRLADLFPNARSLDDILNLIAGINPGPILTAINVNALPGNPPSTGIPINDVNLVTAAINPLSPDLGTAVSSVVTLTNSNGLTPPVPHTNLFADLTAVNTALGPGASLGANVSTDLALIDTVHLTPPQASTNTIYGDLQITVGRLNATPNLTLGIAISNDLLLIGLGIGSSGIIGTDLNTILTRMGPYLSLQGGITALFTYIHTSALPTNPASSGVVSTDLITVKNAINSGALIDLGTAVDTELQYIATQLLPGNPASTNIIHGDLQTTVGKISPLSLNLGSAVSACVVLINTAALMPPIASTGVILSDLQTILNAINLGSSNLGAAVVAIIQKMNPGSPSLSTAVNALITLIGVNNLVPMLPSTGVVSGDIQTLINIINFGSTSLGGAFQTYRSNLIGLIGTADMVPPIATTNNPTLDIQAIINVLSPGSLTLGAAVAAGALLKPAILTLIGTGSLTPPVLTSNNINTDLGVIISKVFPGSLNQGAAVSSVLNQINTASLTPPLASSSVISTDIGTIISKMNPASLYLGSAVTALLTLIGTPNLTPPIVSTGVMSTDIGVISGKINATPNLTLGAAVSADLLLIDTGSLLPSVASSSVISTDLAVLTSKINPTVGITQGTAVATELIFIDTATLPGTPPSTGVIHSDLVLLRNLIKNAGSPTLGTAVTTVSGQLYVANTSDLFTLASALLTRANQMANTGVNIPAGGGPFTTLDQFFTFYGF